MRTTLCFRCNWSWLDSICNEIKQTNVVVSVFMGFVRKENEPVTIVTG